MPIYNNRWNNANSILNKYFEFDLTNALKEYFNANPDTSSFAFVMSSLTPYGLVTAARNGTTSPFLSVPNNDINEMKINCKTDTQFTYIVTQNNVSALASKVYKIYYDSAILQYVNLQNVSYANIVENTPGIIKFRFTPNNTNDSVVATVKFKAIADGKAIVGLIR
jgi:hypothetical protein